MDFAELIAIWPQASLEEVPRSITNDDANSLLAAWTSLWHPLILLSSSSLPRWYPADDPPANLKNCVVVVPAASQPSLKVDFIPRAQKEASHVVVDVSDRAAIAEQVISNQDSSTREIDNELVSDFMALGYAYLQIELLTHHMRYANTLDLAYFQKQVFAGATAAFEGAPVTARDCLSRCFDALAQERDHYYPMDIYVVDLLLMAPSTIGEAFALEIQGSTPINVMLSGEVIQYMADHSPEALSALRAAVEGGSADIVGGEMSEGCLAMLSPESIRDQFERGFASYLNGLGKRPVVFGRRRFGLSPILPQILDSLEYEGALHATLDDGQFPVGSQAKSRWQGVDGSEIESLSRVPLDAARASTFLNFATRLSETMDGDHVATVCLAHWPGLFAPWREDLLRIARYGPVLGTFVTLTEYFEQTQHAGYEDRHGFDHYRNPYLEQAVAAGEKAPISKWLNHYRQMALQMAGSITSTMENCIAETASPQRTDDDAVPDNSSVAVGGNIAQALAATLPHDGSSEAGVLIWNPWVFSRRCNLEFPLEHPAPVAKPPTYCVERCADLTRVVVDIPSTGFAWIPYSTESTRVKPPSQPMAEGNTLRNEHMEVIIDPVTGTLRSLHDFRHRGNRLSQQLAYRLPARESSRSVAAPEYSVMAADHVAVASSTSVMGKISCRGRLLDRDGRELAGYQQSYTLWRGSRVLMLSIRLDMHESLLPEPWNSYVACRFAWNDVGASIVRDVAYTRQPTEARRFEAPHYVEIEMPDGRTSILTQGLPFHQRIGPRMLDSLLIVRGETAREFRFGIGLDLEFPLQEGLSHMGPPENHVTVPAPPTPSQTAWLLHVDSMNVLLTHTEPWKEESQIIGIRFRALETEGKRADASLSCFRGFDEATKVNLLGRDVGKCDIVAGCVRLDLNPYEWATIEARFGKEVNR